MVIILDVELDLAGCFLLSRMPNPPPALLDFDPCHPANFIVDHEAQCVGHVRLVRNLTQAVPFSDGQALFHYCAQLWDKLRVRHVDFEELLRIRLVVHHRVLVNDVDLDAGVLGLAFSIELEPELLDVLWVQIDVPLYDVDVEVRSEIVHVCGN